MAFCRPRALPSPQGPSQMPNAKCRARNWAAQPFAGPLPSPVNAKARLLLSPSTQARPGGPVLLFT